MSQAQNMTIRFPIESDLVANNIRRLSDLINDVYDDAESGMWKRKGFRTNPAEVERLLRAQALILAEIDGALVGAVRVNLMPSRGLIGGGASSILHKRRCERVSEESEIWRRKLTGWNAA
jgi:hypothetical protein